MPSIVWMERTTSQTLLLHCFPNPIWHIKKTLNIFISLPLAITITFSYSFKLSNKTTTERPNQTKICLSVKIKKKKNEPWGPGTTAYPAFPNTSVHSLDVVWYPNSPSYYKLVLFINNKMSLTCWAWMLFDTRTLLDIINLCSSF